MRQQEQRTKEVTGGEQLAMGGGPYAASLETSRQSKGDERDDISRRRRIRSIVSGDGKVTPSTTSSRTTLLKKEKREWK
ncbi:MAG: hypothetical protein QHJ34_01325 [bacterium]|nr:hypothetical protein [candidate division KSB1 bacterium]MDH7558859.1 hypothetical protein [bacterium]